MRPMLGKEGIWRNGGLDYADHEVSSHAQSRVLCHASGLRWRMVCCMGIGCLLHAAEGRQGQGQRREVWRC